MQLGGKGIDILVQLSAVHQGGNVRFPQLHHCIGIAAGEHPGREKRFCWFLGFAE